MGEVRYASLVQSFPEEAKRLHAQLESECEERYELYKRMSEAGKRRLDSLLEIENGTASRWSRFSQATPCTAVSSRLLRRGCNSKSRSAVDPLETES